MQMPDMRQSYRQYLQDTTDALKKDFEAMDREITRVLPIGTFERDFLPMFMGQKVPDAQERMQLWYTIAGSDMAPVNLIDAAGNVVLQVPAIHSNPFQFVSDRKQTLGAEITEAATHGNVHPRLGEARVAETLAQRLAQVQVPDKPSAAWQAVFDHFKATGAKSGEAGSAQDFGEFNYDEM